jgi:hypothetical protein
MSRQSDEITPQVGIKFDREVHKQIMLMARENERTLAGQVRYMVNKYLDANKNRSETHAK